MRRKKFYHRSDTITLRKRASHGHYHEIWGIFMNRVLKGFRAGTADEVLAHLKAEIDRPRRKLGNVRLPAPPGLITEPRERRVFFARVALPNNERGILRVWRCIQFSGWGLANKGRKSAKGRVLAFLLVPSGSILVIYYGPQLACRLLNAALK
jgi:hypothetical protein